MGFVRQTRCRNDGQGHGVYKRPGKRSKQHAQTSNSFVGAETIGESVILGAVRVQDLDLLHLVCVLAVSLEISPPEVLVIFQVPIDAPAKEKKLNTAESLPPKRVGRVDDDGVGTVRA